MNNAEKEVLKFLENQQNWINCDFKTMVNIKGAISIIINQERVIENQKQEINDLKKENHDLQEQLQMFIPRRRVRRVYKMLGKILRTDVDPIILEKELKEANK